MTFTVPGDREVRFITTSTEDVGFRRLDFLDSDTSSTMSVALRAARTTEVIL